jgi:hypothetical protein
MDASPLRPIDLATPQLCRFDIDTQPTETPGAHSLPLRSRDDSPLSQVYVVDCGKHKEKTYDADAKIACLLPAFVSQVHWNLETPLLT